MADTLQNSDLIKTSSLKQPNMELVFIVTSGFLTPRVVIALMLGFILTPTPIAQNFKNRVGDLRRQALLNLQPFARPRRYALVY